MVRIDEWMKGFADAVEAVFGDRAVFIGLQGSYGRGEADERSDIDAVLILDRLDADDLEAYGKLTAGLAHRELLCGFLSGWEELRCWTPAELFQFYHDTTPYKGSLDPLCASLGRDAAEAAVQSGACALYHACVHNLLHEKEPEMLRGLYKTAAFVVQAVYYCETGEYIRQRAELLERAPSAERDILAAGAALRAGQPIGPEEFRTLSHRLLAWAQGWICKSGCHSDGMR